MRKLFVLALLVLGLAGVASQGKTQGYPPPPPPPPGHPHIASEPIQVELIEDGSQTIAAVTLDGTPDADSIIVTMFYWQEIPGSGGPLLLSKTDVQPAYKGVCGAICWTL
jgi:hypothetical protein